MLLCRASASVLLTMARLETVILAAIFFFFGFRSPCITATGLCCFFFNVNCLFITMATKEERYW